MDGTEVGHAGALDLIEPVMVLISFSIGLVMSFSMSTTELLLYGVPMNTSGVTTSGKLTLGITM
jgi:hypothetical protein